MLNCSSRLPNSAPPNPELPTPISFFPLPKYCRADAHHSSAFFDRDLIIVGHTYRQVAGSIPECVLPAQLVSQFTQPAKVWADLFRFSKEGRQSHESHQSQPLGF